MREDKGKKVIYQFKFFGKLSCCCLNGDFVEIINISTSSSFINVRTFLVLHSAKRAAAKEPRILSTQPDRTGFTKRLLLAHAFIITLSMTAVLVTLSIHGIALTLSLKALRTSTIISSA
mgnify:CR=1 FL=1